MKLLSIAVACLALVALPAAAEPARESTIREIIEVTNARTIMDRTAGQIDAMMRQMMEQMMQGQSPTPKQQAALDRYRESVSAITRETLVWERFEPMFIRLYRETFTEEELQPLLAFYRSPPGQAFIAKMPALQEHMMREMPGLMTEFTPKFQAAAKQLEADLKAARDNP